ncbi:hypothetical protein AB4Z09_19495 [Rhodococcus sp. TAF43]|uniref:hypothetical protein n=1 Tax=unclassified Rhodococcus (in: high G+C Gram-positive bacteria) TaxID=192944 RepID=UPI001582D1B1|nr:hypothetical protein [Rhodococcus sp. W8901]QKT09814.1 hypothetical protein HUN07_02930 [Rhodococcus sp. W8901]
MDESLTLQKALLQLDYGRVEKAEVTLRELLDRSQPGVLRVRALVVYGDLLQQLGRADEATALLESAVREASDLDVDDLLDMELERARDLLG